MLQMQVESYTYLHTTYLCIIPAGSSFLFYSLLPINALASTYLYT